MKEVTDPSILAQLEGTEVTDPNIISQLEGNGSQLNSHPAADWLANNHPLVAKGVVGIGNAISPLVNNPVANSIYGAGDEMQKIFSAGHMRGTAQESGYADPSKLSYTLGQIGGGALAGGSLISLLGGLGLTGAAGRIGGGALAGALPEPEDRGKGAILGGALGALPELGIGASKLFSKMRPNQIAESLKNALSDSSLDKIEAPVKDMYQEAFGQAGKSNIYGEAKPLGNLSLEDLSGNIPDEKIATSGVKYTDLDSDQVKSIYSGRGLKLLHNQFIDNPTLENAHNLQSQLGKQVRNLNVKESVSKSLDAADTGLRDSYSFARNLLKNDINTFLDTQGPDLSNVYKQAAFEHATNVVPYRNAASMIDAHIGPNESINAKTLARALSRASTEKNLNKTPLPQDIIDAGVELSGRLKNKALSQKIAGGALGAGLAGELIKHTFF